MAQMNISISDHLKGWAEARVAEGRYSSTSDYVRDLVRRDQDQEQAIRRLQAMIEAGVASDASDQMVDTGVDRQASDHARTVDVLRGLWSQGIASGLPVEGNFDAANVARCGADAIRVARMRG